MRKVLIWGSIILIIILSILIYWNYYNTYSEGNRSGILQKFSKKGNVFKTFEGELIMSSIVSTGSVTITSEKFFFSVTNDSIAKMLFDLEGKRVIVHYKEKRHRLPWNGDSKYLVEGVKVGD